VLLKSSQSPVWTSNEKRFQRPEYVAVKVLFEMQDKTAGEAVCYYDYDAVDETALTHSQPLSAYSTVPYQMELNGTLVDQHKMHKTILGQQQQLFDKFVASLLQIVNDLLGRSN
jgi:hypothetical protein